MRTSRYVLEVAAGITAAEGLEVGIGNEVADAFDRILMSNTSTGDDLL